MNHKDVMTGAIEMWIASEALAERGLEEIMNISYDGAFMSLIAGLIATWADVHEDDKVKLAEGIADLIRR